jgi:hypothetical protein
MARAGVSAAAAGADSSSEAGIAAGAATAGAVGELIVGVD